MCSLVEDRTFLIKGDLLYSTGPGEIRTAPDSYLLCLDGVCGGVFETLPEKYRHLPVHDAGGKLVMPGLTDLHVHAPQYSFRGLNMDVELLDWLNDYAFPEEISFADAAYADCGYGMFVDELKHTATTRCCVFATIHRAATIKLMDLLEESGIVAYVGKVNMDRNCPAGLKEADSLGETRRWLDDAGKRAYKNVAPIITPRFIPSCTDELLRGLGALAMEQNLPVQSHLSENPDEVKLVQKLCPDTAFYGDAYDQFKLFGQTPTIMAHCVYSNDEEIARMKERGVYIAHCPESNSNLRSGVAPVRRYIDEGLRVGLATDVAGGSSLSLFRTMAEAIRSSKLRWRLQDASLRPLTVPEVFYMATLGGGSFFGKVGSFLPGYELDAVVIDDRRIKGMYRNLDPVQRLERFIYLGEDRDIVRKFVRGREIM